MMLMDAEDGALLVCHMPADAVIAGLESVAHGMGYTDDDPADFEIAIRRAPEGVGLAFAAKKDFALALGRKVAMRLKRPVRVFTVSIVYAAGTVVSDKFDCVVDDFTLAADGTVAPGPFGQYLVEEFGDDWARNADGKAHLTVGTLLEEGLHFAFPDIGDDESQSMYFRSPPSLGSPRLDDLAMKVRLADRAELTKMAGRACVRLTRAGLTQTSFLEAEEVEPLRSVLSS